MSEDKLNQLLKVTEENNLMLKLIISYLQAHNDKKDFAMNYIANILSNFK